jgi:uncharacterized protein YaaR (DUF327 family)
MMDIYRVSRLDAPVGYGVSTIASGSGGNAGNSFREHLGGQLKEDYKNRIKALLDELAALSDELLVRVDMRAFERYISQMRELLAEIVRNAYVLSNEEVMDGSGRQRIFSTVAVIDEKLDALALDVLNESSDRLDYLVKVDEIRGLVMDLLL